MDFAESRDLAGRIDNGYWDRLIYCTLYRARVDRLYGRTLTLEPLRVDHSDAASPDPPEQSGTSRSSTSMRTQRGRRVTIADGMVLIAAMTVGLAMARSYARSLYRDIPAPSSLRTFLLFQGTMPCLVFTLMLALIPLRLRRPRPRLGSLVRQPGFAACCAARRPLLPVSSRRSRRATSSVAGTRPSSSGLRAPVGGTQ